MMTVKTFYEQDPAGPLIFPGGPPELISDPGWWTDGDDEMAVCQREVFLKLRDDVPNVLLEDVLDSYVCIGFMSPEEAYGWLPLRMAASIYASRTGRDSDGSLSSRIGTKLAPLLDRGRSPVPREGVLAFWKASVAHEDNDPELFESMVKAGIFEDAP